MKIKKLTTSDNNNFTIDQFISIMKTKVDNLEVEDADRDLMIFYLILKEK